MKWDISKIWYSIRDFAWVYTLGGVGALILMKNDIFVFDPEERYRLAQVLSYITITCAFIAGGNFVIPLLRKMSEMIKGHENTNNKKEGV